MVLLQVSSEDTVLYTAQAYLDQHVPAVIDRPPARTSLNLVELATIKRRRTEHACQRSQISSRLAAFVRCPHLSQFWLSASVLSDDAPQLLLGALRPQLQRLLLSRQGSASADVTVDQIKAEVPEAPASWLLPRRASKQVSSVQLQWSIDVAAIRAAAETAAQKRQASSITQSTASAPFMGITWGIGHQCFWDAADASKQGVVFGVYATANNLLAGAVCRATFSMECDDPAARYTLTHRFKPGLQGGLGWRDYFRTGPMPTGFDEVAWAAKGLPTSGQLVLRLTVRDVFK